MADSSSYRERRLTSQDGLSLFYRDYGDPLSERRPLLCLGGLARNSKDFRSFAERHAKERRVVCPDYRGRGRSDYDPNWRNYRPEVSVGDLFHLMAAANLHRVVVLGISMGGLLAMGLSLLVPSQIAAVILDDVGPEVTDVGVERIRAYIGRDHPQPDLASAIAECKRLFPNLGPTDEDAWRRFAEATFREGDDGVWHVDWDISLAKALTRERPDLWGYYGALKPFPVLAFRGALSDVLSAETFERMAEVKPDLVRVTVPDVGHVPLLETPMVEQAIDDFLAEIDSRV